MDYTYAAGLENNSQILGVAHPLISSTPSEDFVIPGSANLIHMFPTIVPIFGRNQTTIEKKVDNLTGTGDTNERKLAPSDSETQPIESKAEALNLDVEESLPSNSRKRGLPDGILDSFLHPKLLKTETIKIESHLQKKKPVVFKSVVEKKSFPKHKFNVVE